ncbi:RNA-directed DNA polymerase, eukaryota [Tanacetum coccineum]
MVGENARRRTAAGITLHKSKKTNALLSFSHPAYRYKRIKQTNLSDFLFSLIDKNEEKKRVSFKSTRYGGWWLEPSPKKPQPDGPRITPWVAFSRLAPSPPAEMVGENARRRTAAGVKKKKKGGKEEWGRIVWVDIEGVPLHAWSRNTFIKIGAKWGDVLEMEECRDDSFARKRICIKTKQEDNILEKFKIIVKGKVFVVRAKELFAWSPNFIEMPEMDYYSDVDSVKEVRASQMESCQQENLEEVSDNEAVSDTFFGDNVEKDGFTADSCHPSVGKETSDDPFKIYDLLIGRKMIVSSTSASCFRSLQGFRLNRPAGGVAGVKKEKGGGGAAIQNSQKMDDHVYQEPIRNDQNRREGGSILELLEGMLKVGQTMGFSMDGVRNDMEKITGAQGDQMETKMDSISDMDVKILWGNTNFDFSFSEAVGNSGDEAYVDFCLRPPKLDHINACCGLTWDRLLIVGLERPLLWGFDQFVNHTWSSISLSDSNGMIRFKKKLQILKKEIRVFVADQKKKKESRVNDLKDKLSEIDKVLDQGGVSDDILLARTECKNALLESKAADSRDYLQKAKIQWAVEGDENSKFFHGIVNRKRANLTVKGIMIDGDWVDEPSRVKSEFRNYFADRFQDPGNCNGKINFTFPNRLSLDQVADLENPITRDEIRKAVWGCGENKSPGPDGFTFEFFRKFWQVVGPDFCTAVEWFFDHAAFPIGCNSSFIALIPKSLEPKFVGDFWPISLIGCVYKVITKILQSRLSLVISDLISDAYDSIRWDYLEDVLCSFGFGSKWRSWIRGCLTSSMASILVNGSPTSEFQFHRGLKQGDPLAPYLFILVMESLHLSFSRVIDAGIFTGIRIDPTTMISHLFYADDAVFIGEWSLENLNGIMQMLRCFSLLSGLSINIKKSHILGVGIPSSLVNEAASRLGCSVMKVPFKYLGITVGGNTYLVKSWDDTIYKLKSRLSKWKLKTLSIGGRFTLLKSVLGSTPIYNMFLYKVPKAVLNTMESIKRNFFNGIQENEKKIAWIKWTKVLAPKNHGGIGVSSFYALNRALLFKWMWRFLSRGNSLWFRTILAIHGPYGQGLAAAHPSNWSTIIKEVDVLKAQGIDLISHCKIRIGNGRSTSFWKDLWIGDCRLCDKFPRLYALDVNKECSVTSKMSDSFTSSFRRVIRGGIESTQLSDIMSILGLVILSSNEDRYFWDLNGDGDFRV